MPSFSCSMVAITLLAILLFWSMLLLERQLWSASQSASPQTMYSYRAEELKSSEETPGTTSELHWKKKQIIDSMRTFPSLSLARESNSCSGKYIYIHKLPRKYNEEILEQCQTFLPWFSMCEYFTNFGMGLPVDHQTAALAPQGKWFQTNQYSLDVLFHQKLLHHPCLTDSPEQAALFYIPFYAGLDVLRYHYTNDTLEKKNELGVELMGWLRQQRWWWRNDGRDHLLVMGKITWDFRRNNDTKWGNTLLKMPEFNSLTKLLLERDPWEVNEVAVPHPTYFHPSSDADVKTWLSRVETSTRSYLISFAGMPRDPEHIRTHLINQCESLSSLCKLLPCAGNTCNSPEPTMELFMSSEFCMQPPGDSATRRSVFDSLIAGCIPVLFDPDSAYFQYPWHLPEDSLSYSIYVPSEDVKKNRVNVVKLVEGIPEQSRLKMRSKIIKEIVPGLLYSQPGARLEEFEDAFDITIRKLYSKVASL